MGQWIVQRTDTFLSMLKKFKHNQELFKSLEQKIIRLQEDPFSVGGFLAGNLHGHCSTRLLKNFRLIFSVDRAEKKVFLEAIDHRKDVY